MRCEVIGQHAFAPHARAVAPIVGEIAELALEPMAQAD
jgi:hypothetical protein